MDYTLSIAEGRTAAEGMVAEGESATMDDAVHALRDMGEINNRVHKALLSKAERVRIYG